MAWCWETSATSCSSTICHRACATHHELPSLPTCHTVPTQGTHPLLCPIPCTGTTVSDKLVFGVEKNSTFLECLAHSPQMTVRWLVQHGEETGLSEVEGTGQWGRGTVVAPSPGTDPQCSVPGQEQRTLLGAGARAADPPAGEGGRGHL